MSDITTRLQRILEVQSENRSEIDGLKASMADLSEYLSGIEQKATRRAVNVCGGDAAAATGYWLRGLIETKRQNLAAADEAFDASAALMGVTKATLNESTDSQGGVFAPTPIQAVVHELAERTGVLRRAGARVVPMESDTLTLPKLLTRIGFATYNELATINQTDSTFGSVTLTARAQAGMTAASNQVLSDSVVKLGDWFIGQAAAGMARLEDSIVFSAGDGAYFTALPADTGITNVTAATYGFELVNKILFESMDLVSQENAVVVSAPKSYRQLVNTTDAGGLVCDPFGGSPSPTVYGRPFLTTDVITANTSASLVAGDFRNAVVIGERQPLSVLVDQYSLANTLATRFIFSRRIGYATILPGALIRSTNVTY